MGNEIFGALVSDRFFRFPDEVNLCPEGFELRGEDPRHLHRKVTFHDRLFA